MLSVPACPDIPSAEESASVAFGEVCGGGSGEGGGAGSGWGGIDPNCRPPTSGQREESDSDGVPGRIGGPWRAARLHLRLVQPGHHVSDLRAGGSGPT